MKLSPLSCLFSLFLVKKQKRMGARRVTLGRPQFCSVIIKTFKKYIALERKWEKHFSSPVLKHMLKKYINFTEHIFPNGILFLKY